MAEDVLSRAISHFVNSGLLKTASGPNNFSSPSHVMYADDMLVFCNGSKRNLQALMSLLSDYRKVSGQHINLGKCKFYMGSHCTPRRRAQISASLGFSAGSFPFNYLGVPIFKGKPSRAQLQPIADRILSKLASWKGMLLSIMGRVELTKSVVHSMLLYSFQVYAWPVKLLNHLDRCIRNFIWSGDILTRKMVIVAWSKMSCPVKEGGVGIKSLGCLNKAALLTLSWNMITADKDRASFLRGRFLQHGKPSTRYIKSSVWPGIKSLVTTALSNSIWLIGDGKDVNFWLHNRLSKPIVDMLNIPDFMHNSLATSVADFIKDGKWNMPEDLLQKLSDAGIDLAQVPVPTYSEKYKLIWRESNSGNLSFKDAYLYFNPPKPHLDRHNIIWNKFIPPSKSLVAWRLLYGRLPTEDELQKRGCTTVSVCCFCYQNQESMEHIFFHCSYARSLWSWLGSVINCNMNSITLS